MSESEHSEDADGFAVGQTEPLTTRLRGLIREYPEGVGIVKELLQNADDSGARILHIVIDWRTHRTDRLPDPRMASLQGPALLAFNNREFTNDDLQNIQKIGHGGKIQSAAKTGRFGLGFNAVYNITDWPSFVTGDRLVYFDPHLSAIPGAIPTQPGRGWKLTAKTWERFHDLLVPFVDAGLPLGAKHFNGSIFRLSFRTPAQAEKSEIKRQTFARENVEAIIAELLKTKEQLLLFLKNIEELRISEIQSDGTHRAILSIETIACEEVRRARQALVSLLDGDSLDVVNRLQGSDGESTFSVFSHSFRITTRGKSEEAKWQIVSGLFADTRGDLLEAARQMAQVGEKAVPWAAVAARISGGARRVKGTVYCTLPLPIESGLPVHIHGFFDLDSSRSALTAPGGQTGTDRIRGEWNRLLLRHGVAAAYARLIASLTTTLGEEAPKAYYELWPVKRLNAPFDALEQSVATHLAELPVIRTAGEPRWANAREVWALAPRWEELQGPLVAEQLPVAEPPLSPSIREFFTHAGVEIDEYTAQDLRQELRDSLFTRSALESAPRPCLRRRSWLEVLLRFCLSDDSRDLQHLPLALLATDELRTFDAGKGVVYMATQSERRIFATKKEWFLDEVYARNCRIPEAREAGIENLTPHVVVKRLAELIPVGENGWLDWKIDSRTPPNLSWITLLYQYFIRAAETGFEPPKEAMEKLALVPTRGGRLFPPGYASTPLLVRDELDETTLSALAAYGILTVEAPPPLRSVIRAFADTFPGEFIWPLRGPDVVDTLAVLEQFSDCGETNHRRLIDYLSDRRWLAGDGAYDESHREKLRKLAIFPTTSGEYVALGEGVFRQGALGIDIAVPLKLLKAGDNEKWLSLYEFLQVPVLDRTAFLLKGLLPGYKGFHEDTKLQGLQWMRDNLDQIETDHEDHESAFSELINKIKCSKLIHCTDGEYRAPENVFDPDSTIVEEVLGKAVNKPSMDSTYERGASHWLRFFRRIGMQVQPSAVDIARRIDRIRETVEKSGMSKDLNASLLRIYNYVIEQWKELTFIIIPLVGGRSVTFGAFLQTRQWLPAEREPKELERYAAFTIPEDRLYKPSEVRFTRQGHLTATQRPIFRGREPDPTVREGLAFGKHIAPQEVLAHFQKVVERWKLEGDHLDKEKFADSLDLIYQEFERLHSRSDRQDEDAPAKVDLTAYFVGKPCVWHEGKFWLPEHAFQMKVPFFGARRVSIPRARARFYEPLGIKTEPEVGDFVDLIEEIATEFGREALPQKERANLIEVFRQLGLTLSGREPDPTLLVLTDDWRLARGKEVFSPDAAWFEPRLDRTAILLLHRDLRSTMARAAGVRSLAQSVVERPVAGLEMVDDADCPILFGRWESNIRSEAFRQGVERLIWSADCVLRPGALSWLAMLNIKGVSKISTELYVKVDGTELRVGGGGTTDSYFDPHTNTMYLSIESRRPEHHLAKALANQIEEAPLQDLAPLIDMVKSKPGEIEDLLDDLRVPRPPDSTAPEYDPPPGEEFDEGSGDNSEVGANEQPVEAGEDTSEDPRRFVVDASTENNGASAGSDSRKLEVGGEPKAGAGKESEADRPGKFPKKDGDEQRKPQAHKDGDEQRKPQPHRQSGPPATDLRRKDRIVTYVANKVPEASNGREDESNEEERRWKVEFGAKGVECVCEYERNRGRRPEKMGQNSPGYDVTSFDPASGQTRFIEVKSINGAWSPRGVGLSATQFVVAQSKGDAFWLYVVEHANSPENSVVHAIQDPAAKITEYRFDEGWRQLATTEFTSYMEMRQGARITISAKGEGTIQGVKRHGALEFIVVELDSGSIWKGAYNPSTMKVLN